MNKELFGQYFTPEPVVEKMIGLIQNQGKVLEPSCGDGAFMLRMQNDYNITGIEIDPDVACKNSIIMDFFDWGEKVQTIIGNPPYVRYQDIYPETLKKLPAVMDKRANLYLFFIWRCIDLLDDNGELIFIVPRDFIKTTSARSLNERLYNEGGFTYWEEYGDIKVFKDANPNVVIFRWVKNQKHQIPISLVNGFLTFEKKQGTPVKEIFEVRVGAVSGANNIFYTPNGNIDIAVSTTKNTGQTIKALYVDQPNDYLIKYKDVLINRGIRTFTEQNWWEWGRKITPLDKPAILVNCKTRDPRPFYKTTALWYDGSLLALIPKTNKYSLDKLVEILNNTDWEQQGFKVGGRLVFGQRNLSEAILQINT